MKTPRPTGIAGVRETPDPCPKCSSKWIALINRASEAQLVPLDERYYCRCMKCGCEGPASKDRNGAFVAWNKNCNCPECDRVERLDK